MQMGLEKFVRLASRTGRELQRYDEFGLGRRQVVGCIPYRYLNAKQSSSSSSSIHGILEEVEVLLITSQKSQTMMFPKGGWDSDETIEEAVKRESEEEAGVTGVVQCMLGTWCFKSKSREAFRDGYMFLLLVEEQLDHWPEKNTRQRRWVKIAEARELCPYLWMKEALDQLVQRLASSFTAGDRIQKPAGELRRK
ncbi:hypothetical protein Nepgr_025207 [Nepenthes gracilis]|uniref:Nudix hydrolase domain-containing protein n=1 Tax=Nepenthes gracilis TaxID=150966 RepID=A0AAD3T5Y6_NEPGR|nr:hypothetical protein Nepgr_025207 [Nepenthes gracilis]